MSSQSLTPRTMSASRTRYIHTPFKLSEPQTASKATSDAYFQTLSILSYIHRHPLGPSCELLILFLQNQVTESNLYQQMALTASTNAYSWSKWNSEVESEEKIVLQGQEHLQDEPLQEVHR